MGAIELFPAYPVTAIFMAVTIISFFPPVSVFIPVVFSISIFCNALFRIIIVLFTGCSMVIHRNDSPSGNDKLPLHYNPVICARCTILGF